jgi:isopentenyl-diphosphate delta-isomerase
MENDILVLVNEQDKILGYEEKIKAHLGEGKKHRAFSIFIFDNSGKLLIQKRASEKMLWPSFWANTCCSHPRKDESYEDASKRRLKEEIGIEAKLEYKYKFSYKAKYKDIGSESELCSVFFGEHKGDEIKPNSEEIEEWKWIGVEELKQDIKNHPEIYAPWFKMEMERIEKGIWGSKRDNRIIKIQDLRI